MTKNLGQYPAINEISRARQASADICHFGCAVTVLDTVKMYGVYSAAYGTVHYKEPLKSFEIRVGHSPGFGLSSVAILLCSAESDVKQ